MEEFDDAMDNMEKSEGVPSIMGATVAQSIMTTMVEEQHVPAFEERQYQEIREEMPITDVEKELEKVLEKAQVGSAVQEIIRREAEESMEEVIEEKSEIKEEPIAEAVAEIEKLESIAEQKVASIVSPIKKPLTIETENLEENHEKTYQIKLMSSQLKNQKTPQVMSGIPIDPDTKEKIKTRRKRILGLEIDINAPEYDGEGNLIYEEEDDEEEEPEALNGIFNVHLLDEEVLDQQVYLGSRSNSLNSSQ